LPKTYGPTEVGPFPPFYEHPLVLPQLMQR